MRSRPLRTAAIVGAVVLSFASAAAVRRQQLRQDSLQKWSARSRIVAQLSATSANAWLAGRSGDARLIAASAGRSPQLFRAREAGDPRLSASNLSASLAQSLAALNLLHPYASIWLLDNAGKVVATSSAQPAPSALRMVALASLTMDSGRVVGPFPGLGKSLSIAFAHRVVAAPPAHGPPSAITGRVIGSVVLTSHASSLLVELAGWSERSGTESTSLIVESPDSVFRYAVTPVRARGSLIGAWPRSSVPRAIAAAFGATPDTLARTVKSQADFITRLDGMPWALSRSDSIEAISAAVDGRLTTEMSTTAAVIFMIAIIVIARRQTSRERKLLEVAESEVRYRLLADNATDVIVRHAPDGRVVYVSPAVQATLGLRPRQLEGRHLSELSHVDDVATVDHILNQLRGSHETLRIEHRLQRADNAYIWVETTGRAIRDPVWGNVTEFVTVSRDIESRKEAEEALRASEEEYRVLFDANPLPMWAFDADSNRFVAVNDASVEHYGYSREEFLQMTIFDIRPPEDASLVHDRLARIAAGTKEFGGSRHRKKDGTMMDVDLTVHPVKFGGRMTWLVLVKDVTETIRAAAALRESDEFVSTLFDSSPVAIIATDLDLRVVKWNGAAERLFGWQAEEVIGKPYPLASEAMQSDLAHNRELALRGSRSIDVHSQRCCKDGTVVDVSLSVGAVRNGELHPTGFVIIAADLTEHAKLEAQLRQAQKMDAVGQLAGGVAHDFNNLLTVITGYAGLLLSDLPEDVAIRADVSEIMGAANRAAILTRQLLAFSRQQVLEPRVLDLNDVVEGMEQMLRRVLPADIEVKTMLDPALGSVSADPGQLEQVLMNLIVNARDAMPGGGTITIETMDFEYDANNHDSRLNAVPGEYVMLAVSDTGCGMSGAVQARIFEPFFTTKERGKGTGLGLSTAHGIITQSGGYLSVHSEPALGATFKVCLPKVQGDAARSASTTPRTVSSTGSEVILLVEDDAHVRGTATRILESAGYRVLPSCNGKEALDIFRKQSAGIDLVVTDTIMHEMSGLELVARIRERKPDIAVLVMSGYTEQTSGSHTLIESGSAFIQKPFTPEGLTAKVRSAIDNASALAMVS